MAGSALTPAARRKTPARTERCLLLEAVPWEDPTYGILGGRLETWSRAELRTHPATERAGLEILLLRMRAPVPHPTIEEPAPGTLVGLIEERQRRPYGGLEFVRHGHGGDVRVAVGAGMSPATFAKVRKRLLRGNLRDRSCPQAAA